MTKTLNHIIFFSSTKIRIFFSATLGTRIFFFIKITKTPPPPPPPPWMLNGPSLNNLPINIKTNALLCKSEDISSDFGYLV